MRRKALLWAYVSHIFRIILMTASILVLRSGAIIFELIGIILLVAFLWASKNYIKNKQIDGKNIFQ
jgi:hypothetical protein